MTCLDGVGKVTIDGEEYILKEGDSIVMPANIPMRIWTGTVQDAAGSNFLRLAVKETYFRFIFIRDKVI